VKATDVILFLALMLSWAYGAFRTLFVFPLLHWNPDWAASMGYYEHFPAVGTAFLLLWSLSSGLVAPFAEELVFRGYLQNLWHHSRGLWAGVALSAIWFGLAHLQAAVFAAVAGVLLSLVYIKFGSLCPGMLFHGLYNLVAAPYLLGRIFAQKSADEFSTMWHWIPELVLTAAFFPLLYLFWRRFRPQR
jgi:membrane protease YdiL (CAAX protease family)